MKPEERRQELIVGTVALIIIVATILGVMWGNKYNLFSARNYYTVRVARASGLEEGDPVTVAGVPKGVVDDFVVGGDSVDVIIGLDKDIILFSDASAIIANRELIGGKKVEVHPGSSGGFLKEGGVFRGTFAGGLEDLFETVGSITTNFQTLLATMNTTLKRVNNVMEADVESSLGSIASTARQIDSLMIADIQPSLKAMRSTLETTEELVDSRKDDIAEIVDNLSVVSEKMSQLVKQNEAALNRTISNLDKAGKDMATLGDRIKDPNNSLGRLTNSDSLYQEVKAVVKQVDNLIADVKANPEKYLKHVDVSVDMFGGDKK